MVTESIGTRRGAINFKRSFIMKKLIRKAVRVLVEPVVLEILKENKSSEVTPDKIKEIISETLANTAIQNL